MRFRATLGKLEGARRGVGVRIFRGREGFGFH